MTVIRHRRARPIRHAVSRVALGLVLLYGVVAQAAVAETAYWRVQADRITVIANGNARRAEKMAFQLQVFEGVLRNWVQLDPETTLPPLTLYVLSRPDAQRVFLTDTDRQQQSRRQMLLSGKILPGLDGNLAAIVDIGDVEGPFQAFLLMYAHQVMSQSGLQWYPLWYRIGVAAITNGVLVRTDGSTVLSRYEPYAPDVYPILPLKLDLATVLEMLTSRLNESGDWQHFTRYARNWAQYGLMTTPARRAQYRELATLMRQGTPAEEAVAKAFGAPFAKVAETFYDSQWSSQTQYVLAPPTPLPLVAAAQRIDAAQVPALLQEVAERVKRN